MTDGTYVGPHAVTPIPDDVVSSQEQALSLWPAIDNHIGGLEADINRVFLVGAGGSYLAMVPAQWVLDKHSNIPAVTFNSDEFYYRKPASVGPNSLVVALSGTGNTPETIRAAEWAAAEGAAVVGVTLKAEGPLAQSLETSFVAETGQGTQILLQLVALAVLKRENVDIGPMHEALHALPTALLASLNALEPRAAEIAREMKDVPVTNVLASGPLFGAASTFTMCYLQEMQWKHAATINADEFFQGPFEVIDEDTKTIVFLGEDETRPMGERVQRFLSTYGGETFYVDSTDIPLPGVDQRQRPYVLPLVFHAWMARLAAHYAAARGFTLEGRRYMWKVEY
ncbi:SIS domain-containing protein [Glaciibacter sp. 2TAF33]|uniref:SIS domain-containing protein n=1 Tax=Glaciibacter sp. 2TAF33 TaxID=3233015 RepID=UPI003F917EBE